MAKYVTREGPMATVSVWTNLTTCGSLGTVNQIVVDQGYTSIKELIVAAHINGAATDTVYGIIAVRLTGTGIKYGPVDIPVAGWGNEQTGNSALSQFVKALQLPVDIALVPGGTIWVQAGQSSADLGTPECAVTLCMTKAGGSLKRYDYRSLATASAVDTKTQMTVKMDDTTANQIRVPGDVSKITKLILVNSALATATATGGTDIVKLEGDGLLEGPVSITAGGSSFLSNTTGVDGKFTMSSWLPVDIKVRPGGLIYVYEEHTGVTSGGQNVACGVEFS